MPKSMLRLPLLLPTLHVHFLNPFFNSMPNRYSDAVHDAKTPYLTFEDPSTSTGSPAFLAFKEQMQRIAGILSARIEGIAMQLLRSFIPRFTPSVRGHQS